MRKLLLLALALSLATMMIGCRRGPDPSRYDNREPLPSWEITMRSTGGFDLADMRFVELHISYDGRAMCCGMFSSTTASSSCPPTRA